MKKYTIEVELSSEEAAEFDKNPISANQIQKLFAERAYSIKRWEEEMAKMGVQDPDIVLFDNEHHGDSWISYLCKYATRNRNNVPGFVKDTFKVANISLAAESAIDRNGGQIEFGL